MDTIDVGASQSYRRRRVNAKISIEISLFFGYLSKLFGSPKKPFAEPRSNPGFD